jgi:maltoporin
MSFNKGLFFLLLFSNHCFAENNTVSDFLSYFELFGYTRLGVGTSSESGTQARFQAPGSAASYRLGNEADYGLELGVRFSLPMNGQENKRLEATYQVSDYKEFGDLNQFYSNHTVSQSYINLTEIIYPKLNVWFGRRWYDRMDIHLNDHYWLNTGEGADFGGGIEKETSLGLLKFAAFSIKDENTGNSSVINSNSFEVRLLDIPLNKQHQLNLFSEYITRDGGDLLNVNNTVITTSTENGFGLGAWINSNNDFGITNTIAFIYREGAAFRQGDFNTSPAREDQGFDLNNAVYWEINNNFVFDSIPYSLAWATVIRHEDHGLASPSDIHWYSTGIRPILYLTDHINLALELGVDYVDNEVL